MIQRLFVNTVFKCFLKEIEALGFVVSDSPKEGFLPYGVVGGRSNARWWLVPLSNHNVATSGLALFQPINPSATFLKKAAIRLNSLGMSSLWARNKVYVYCPPVFSEQFGDDHLSYAFFTGTDSPHRKTAIQVMDIKGRIKGFAKVSCAENVQELLVTESSCIEYVRSLRLESIRIPKVMLSGERAEARVLLTDTEKTRHSRSPISFMPPHRAFLSELAAKSTSGKKLSGSLFLHSMCQLAEQFAPCLPASWNQRFAAALGKISRLAPAIKAEMVFCHGDFTPWNTFMVGRELYVFDWEYARHECSPGYDLIHFALALPQVKGQVIGETIGRVRRLIREMALAEDDDGADVLILSYLCGSSLQYIARETLMDGKVVTWGGEQEKALLIDGITGVREH